MKIELPKEINILALHNFAQQQGCRLQQTAEGDMIMKPVIVKFPRTRALKIRNNNNPTTPGAA